MGGTLQKRTPRRARVLLSAVLESAGVKQDVRIRDLSIMGAMLEAADPPPFGSEVVLSSGDTAIKGKVAWEDEVLVGIVFTEALNGQLLSEAESQRLMVAAPRGYRHDRLPPAEPRIRAGDRVISLRKTPKVG